MNKFFILSVFLITLSGGFAHAENVMKDYPVVKMQSLDKVTARTETFEAKVGTTIKFGPLFIRIQACRKTDPIEKPESAAFIQVWEVPPETGQSEWVYSGWMYASSPALSAMDHPVYDVWVLDCLDQEKPNKAALESASDEEAAQDGLSETPPVNSGVGNDTLEGDLDEDAQVPPQDDGADE